MSILSEVMSGMLRNSLPSQYWSGDHIHIPELELCKTVIQKNGKSVWDHTMSVIDIMEVKTPITLLSGLFHDVGKALVDPVADMSLPRFPEHENKSAEIVNMRLKEWKAGSYFIDRVVRLVSTHMFDIRNVTKEKTIRKFIANVGKDNIENWFVLRVADSQSYANQKKYINNFIEPFRESVLLYLDAQPQNKQPKLNQENESGVIQIEGTES